MSCVMLRSSIACLAVDAPPSDGCRLESAEARRRMRTSATIAGFRRLTSLQFFLTPWCIQQIETEKAGARAWGPRDGGLPQNEMRPPLGRLPARKKCQSRSDRAASVLGILKGLAPIPALSVSRRPRANGKHGRATHHASVKGCAILPRLRDCSRPLISDDEQIRAREYPTGTACRRRCACRGPREQRRRPNERATAALKSQPTHRAARLIG